MKRRTLFIIIAIIIILPVISLSAQCGVNTEDKIDISEDGADIEETQTDGGDIDTADIEDEAEQTANEDRTDGEEETGETDSEEGADEVDSEGDDTYIKKEAPNITLEIYEGPVYSAADNVCYYRIKALVAGNPDPTVNFSKDDSAGAWGSKKVQINLNDPSDTYTLIATATNSEGSATDSIILDWGCSTKGLPSPEGTTLVVSKDADGSSEGNIIWDIEKSVDQNHFNLTTGGTATANYTVIVTPIYDENEITVSGNINIKNTGIVTATINYVYDKIEYTIDGVSWTEITTETIISVPFTITASGSSDIPYSVSFTPVEGAKAYRNIALVGLDNYAVSGGVVGFHEYSYITDFSISGGIAHNPFADVFDSLMGYLGETWVGDPSTYEYTYSLIIGPYTKTGDYIVENTATVKGRELSTVDNYSLNITVHVTEPVK